MKYLVPLAVSLAALAIPSGALEAFPQPDDMPLYQRDVADFFKNYCVACHNEDDAKGGLVLESYETLLDGGTSGDVVVPGKSAQSRLLLLLQGKEKPKMPPKDAPQPKPEEIARLAAWIDAGAKGPAATEPATTNLPDVPDIKLTAAVQPAVNSVAFHPNGKYLAVGRYKEVLLLDSVEGRRLARFGDMDQDVSAVLFNTQGTLLVAAGGAAGQFGQVVIAKVAQSGAAPPQLELVHNLRGHDDAIYSAALSPDGSRLATAGYDRLIKLWDTASGKETATLKDHSGAVFAVAFSPDGRLLASAAADAAVKVWDVATGKRLFTMSEPLDYVYCVAYHPNGKQVAAGGLDKRVRIWSVSDRGATLAKTVFAHDGAVVRLAYSPDGKWLLSSGDDRHVKRWHADSLTEQSDFGVQSDWASALAYAPAVPSDQTDSPLLAIGRYDGSLALYDTVKGQVVRDLLAAARKASAAPTKGATPAAAANDGTPRLIPASLSSVTPGGMQRGKSVRFTLRGSNIGDAGAVLFDSPHLTANIVAVDAADRKPGTVQVEIAAAQETPPGVYRFFLHTLLGATGTLPIAVGALDEVAEKEPNDPGSTAPTIPLPATAVGTIGQLADTDVFAFHAEQGQQLVFQVTAGALGSPLRAVLTLTDSQGNVLSTNRTARGLSQWLAYKTEQAGVYTVRISDQEYRGGGNFHYRIDAGPLPLVESFFPLGGQRGTSVAASLTGYNLPAETVQVEIPGDAASGARIGVALESPAGFVLGRPKIVVDDAPQMGEQEPNDALEVAQPAAFPATVNGRVTAAVGNERDAGRADIDLFRFEAAKGQRLVLEVEAQRLGSPLDSLIEVLDAGGNPVPRATVRAVAETSVVLRDHDSKSSGIRIQSWTGWAVDDFVMVGGELLKVAQLPRGPDDNIVFYSFGGQRLGYLATTPQAHALGAPVYRAEIHPPGTTFPKSGLPVREITYRNDDGGPLHGTDSVLVFDPPADGRYLVRITDARGVQGDDFAYRLTIRPPREDFRLTMSPSNPNVPSGGSVPLTVSAERRDGFAGPIQVRIEELPEGFSCAPGDIPGNAFSATLVLHAPEESAAGHRHGPVRLLGEATIKGQKVARVADPQRFGRVVSVVPQPDIRVAVEPAEIEIVPGREQVLTVHVDRLGGFSQRVPISVVDLPHGVRVLDVGLNGILVTEQESSRNFVLYAEPWAEPVARPFYAVGTVESSPPTAHASKAIQLRVVPKTAVATQSKGP